MDKQTVFVLELDGVEAIHLDIGSLKDAIEMEFDRLHKDDYETSVFKLYAKEMTGQEIDNLPDFDGF